MGESRAAVYRVTLRYGRGVQRYEIFELEADDVRVALRLAAERLAEEHLDAADLVEIRRSNPAEPARDRAGTADG